MIYEFNVDKCIEAKNKFHTIRKITSIWRNSFAPSNRIGNCTNLYRKLMPKNYEDFYKKYIAYGKEHRYSLSIRERGLSYEELIELSEEYKRMASECGEDYDLSYFFYDALSHIIIETFDGQYYEEEMKKYLTEKCGYICTKLNGKDDGKYGIDIIINGEKGIQIKPLSFFISDRDDVVLDRINACIKYENTLSEKKMETYYAIYNRDKKSGEVTWAKNGKGYAFVIKDLFSYDPNDIEHTFKDIKFTKNSPISKYTFEKLSI